MNNKTRKHLHGRSDASKLKLLHNYHINAECVILSCGPSINKYLDKIKNLSNVVIIAVKDSIELAPYTNYHLLNFVNIKKYNYTKPKPIVLEIVRNNVSSADIQFPFKHSKTLISTQKFKEYEMCNSFIRPWGPGIMYELGFYLAEHLGCSKITTYGWDNDLSEKSHFNKNINITQGMLNESIEAKKHETKFVNYFRQKNIEINIKR